MLVGRGRIALQLIAMMMRFPLSYSLAPHAQSARRLELLKEVSSNEWDSFMSRYLYSDGFCVTPNYTSTLNNN